MNESKQLGENFGPPPAGRRQTGRLHAPESKARLVAAGTATVVLTLVFFGPLRSLFVHAAGSEVHSHILLVPLVSAYLLYIERHQLPKTFTSSFWAPVMLAALATLALAMGTGRLGFFEILSRNDHLTFMTLAFVCLLAAVGFLLLGKKWMAAAAFPVAFLIFMVPLPDTAVDLLETGSKFASAEAASVFFDLTGTPTLRDGLVFQLPGIAIEVAQECSGIRSSLVLVITSLLAGHLFLKSPWRKLLLVAFVIPLGVIRNGFRIMVIGLLCVHLGREMIHSVIHKRGGPLFFALSLLPLFFFLWWLRRGERKHPGAPARAARNSLPQA